MRGVISGLQQLVTENITKEMLGMNQDGDLFSDRVLVLGNSQYGIAMASEVIGHGYGVVFVCPDSIETAELEKHGKDVEVFTDSTLASFEGEPGKFQFEIESRKGGLTRKRVGAVVVAMDCLWQSALEAWDLGPTERICSVADLENGQIDLQGVGKIVFLSGFVHNSYPFSQGRIVKAAVQIRQEYDVDIYILLEHFKVAHRGMESLFRQAREQGILFVKFTDSRPKVLSSGEGVSIMYYDEALGGQISLAPDILVLDEAAWPPAQADLFSQIMGIHLDQSGFFQGDFIYNLPIYTNRSGVYVVGSGKGPVSKDQGQEEIKAAALEIKKLFSKYLEAGPIRETVRLDKKKCAICLTCYRVCPHRAISYLNRRPVISSLACYSCGICTSVCPMEALELADYPSHDFFERLDSLVGEKDGLGLVVFACQNSAFGAYELARQRRLPLPNDMAIIKVPCGGRVGPEMVLGAFKAGGKGVMVLTCHHDSCKSVMGSHYAQWRASELADMLEEVGIGKERFFCGTLASGMASEFVEMVTKARKTLAS